MVISLTDDRVAYARAAWLDLLIIVVSFPVLPELLAFSRLVRLSRLSRVLRMLRAVPHPGPGVVCTQAAVQQTGLRVRIGCCSLGSL